jgi:aspartyl-tRNA(Asn)/glutamyl-tRNA(Gln) amidotransferase subunit A
MHAAARHRQRRRRLDAHPRLLRRRLRTEAHVRAHPERAQEPLVLRRHGGARPAHEDLADNALYLDLTSGYAPEDPSSLPHPGFSYEAKLAEGAPRRLRIAYSADLGYAVVQTDIAQAVYDAAKLFEKLGHEVVEIKGGRRRMGQAWGMWGAFEMAAANLQHLPEREADFSRAVLASMKLAWEMTPEWFREQATRRLELSRWCQSVFSDYDLLITPTVPYDPPPAKGPFPRETEGREQLDWGVASFTIPFNLSLHPAASLRVGLSRAGMPIGMQIVAERHRDELVLQSARAFERERPWHPHWPVR